MDFDILNKALRNPREAALRLHHLFNRRFLSRDGVRVMAEDWDNLIILDACRYDIFTEYANFGGDLNKKISRGSHTREFLVQNFAGETFPDTVYISATPQLQSTEVHTQFHDYAPLWETAWDENLKTVPPDAVVSETMAVIESHPNKRIIAHLLQPHYPFIGETGEELKHRTVSGEGIKQADHLSIWERLDAGEVTEEVVWQAYVENLLIALPAVKRLVSQLPGRTVVTSDHGNAFGRWGVFGHPQYKFMKELVEVPWMVFEAEERRNVKAEGVNVTGVGDSVIEERLQHLGYA